MKQCIQSNVAYSVLVSFQTRSSVGRNVVQAAQFNINVVAKHNEVSVQEHIR